jgi:hypothetical protein
MSENANDPALEPMAPGPGITLPPATPGEAAILAEMRIPSAVEALEGQLASLRPLLDKARQEAEEEAREAIGKHPSREALREAGPALRQAFLDVEKKVEAVRRNTDLSESGKAARIEDLERLREARVEELREAMQARVTLINQKFPPPAPPALTSDQVHEAALFGAQFRDLLPEDTLSIALAVARRAVDPTLDETQRERARALFLRGYGPHIRRRALVPERHSEVFREQYAQAAAIGRELEEIRAMPNDLAVALGDTVADRFNWLANTARAQKGWPRGNVLESVTMFFAW